MIKKKEIIIFKLFLKNLRLEHETYQYKKYISTTLYPCNHTFFCHLNSLFELLVSNFICWIHV